LFAVFNGIYRGPLFAVNNCVVLCTDTLKRLQTLSLT